MLNTGLAVKGEVTLTLRDMLRGGRIKYQATKRNLVVSVGAIELAKIITSATSGTRPSHMGIGSSTTAPSSGQTDLQSSLYKKALGSTSRSNNQITYSATFTTGQGTGTVQEGALLTATAAGTMFARFLTGAFAKAATDQLTMTWRLTFGTV